MDEAIASLETGKATVDIKSTIAGKIVKLYAKVDQTVIVGNDFAVIDEAQTGPAAGAAAPKAEAPKAEAPKAETAKAEAPKAAPKAEKQAEAPQTKKAPSPEPMPLKESPIKFSREVRRVKLSKLRQTAASRLKEAQNTYAMLTTFNECDMSALTNLKKELSEDFLKVHGARLGFMSAFVKASVASLQKFPALNAVIDGKEIVYHDYIDISVAVSSPKGLVVPVLRNCESLGFADIEKSISDLGARAKAEKIALEEMIGGTFTITNGGVFGSMLSTPIINLPQSGILGLHSIKNRPVVVGNKIEARPMMYLALSYDHRLVDGREAVMFLKNVKELIEDPRKLLLDI
jgi:2-oxoglutarate dehydrogenase E2 component (dihydrolipoamide succinyltransferase)